MALPAYRELAERCHQAVCGAALLGLLIGFLALLGGLLEALTVGAGCFAGALSGFLGMERLRLAEVEHPSVPLGGHRLCIVGTGGLAAVQALVILGALVPPYSMAPALLAFAVPSLVFSAHAVRLNWLALRAGHEVLASDWARRFSPRPMHAARPRMSQEAGSARRLTDT